jgi:hypothetical protein
MKWLGREHDITPFSVSCRSSLAESDGGILVSTKTWLENVKEEREVVNGALYS